MAYTINKTDGTLFATVADGTINTDSSLIMIGKNYAGYGEALNENFFALLESHANATAPSAPQAGQLWYDTSEGIIKVWNNAEWKDLGSSSAGTAGPADPVVGDMWYDTVNSQLNVYDGSTYVLIGPSYSSGTGTTGYLVDTVTDGILEHVIIKVVVSDGVVAIISKDAAFTPIPAIAGYTSIQPGYNLSTNVDGQTPLFIGDATNAQLLDNINSDQFLRSDENDTTSGTLGILNNAGLTVGLLNEAKLSVSGTDVTIQNQAEDGDLILNINSDGTPTAVLTIDAVTARARVPGAAIAGTDIANKDFVVATPANSMNSATTIVDVSASDAPAAGYVLRASSSTAASWQASGETPIGGIIMYSGTLAAIPTNWSICDGTAGTPNLVDRFVYGTATEGQIGDTGGTADAVNILHGHTFTGNALPGHSHTQDGGAYSDGASAAGGDVVNNQWTNNNGTTSSESAGTPTGSISPEGVSGTGLNIPPYVKLAYIMRIS